MTTTVPPLRLGAALGKILASYRDGNSKACAAAMTGIVMMIENLEDQLADARAALSEKQAHCPRCNYPGGDDR